jgi:hypothetical protein
MQLRASPKKPRTEPLERLSLKLSALMLEKYSESGPSRYRKMMLSNMAQASSSRSVRLPGRSSLWVSRTNKETRRPIKVGAFAGALTLSETPIDTPRPDHNQIGNRPVVRPQRLAHTYSLYVGFEVSSFLSAVDTSVMSRNVCGMD